MKMYDRAPRGKTQDMSMAYAKILANSVRDRNGCLVWRGAKTSGGYGQIRADGKQRLVHRVVWVWNNIPSREMEEVAPSMAVDHTCHNVSCVNIDHLVLRHVDRNSRDGMRDWHRTAKASAAYRGDGTKRKNGHYIAPMTEYLMEIAPAMSEDEAARHAQILYNFVESRTRVPLWEEGAAA